MLKGALCFHLVKIWDLQIDFDTIFIRLFTTVWTEISLQEINKFFGKEKTSCMRAQLIFIILYY